MKAKDYIQELCDANLKEWKGMQNLNTNEWLEIMEAYAEERVKNSSIPDVSHQRELLESFRYWLNNTKTSNNNINNGDLDDFLEDYNCG